MGHLDELGDVERIGRRQDSARKEALLDELLGKLVRQVLVKDNCRSAVMPKTLMTRYSHWPNQALLSLASLSRVLLCWTRCWSFSFSSCFRLTWSLERSAENSAGIVALFCTLPNTISLFLQVAISLSRAVMLATALSYASEQ